MTARKKHPHLTLSSFFGNTSQPQPITPSTLRPTRIVDVHPTKDRPASYDGIPLAALDPALRHIIAFPLDLQDLARIKEDPAPVEIQVINPGGLDPTDWERLEELVDGLTAPAGLLPPPLDPTYPSTRLHTAPRYADVYLPHLAALSLNPGVHLMLLPPALAAGEGTGWWGDEEEVKRVTRLYVTPAMECFGSHRIIFGSSPATTATALVPPERWYMIARTVVSELVCGSCDPVEARGEMEAVFAGNAERVWKTSV